VLIDIGVHFRVKEAARDKRLKQIAEDIRSATDGFVDVVTVTHEHADHVNGFESAGDVFDTLNSGAVWLSWMDAPDDKVAAEHCLHDVIVPRWRRTRHSGWGRIWARVLNTSVLPG